MAKNLSLKGAVVRWDPKSLRRLDELTRRQLPFAEARALTLAANYALAVMRRRMRREFDIRNKVLLRRWRVTERAQKKTHPRLRVAIGTPDRLWVDHELGKRRRPKRGRAMAVPSKLVARKRKASGAIPKAWKPGALKAKGKAFRQKDVVRQKTGKRAKFQTPVLYLLRRSVRIKPKLRARATITEAVKVHFRKHFPRVLAEAVASARKA